MYDFYLTKMNVKRYIIYIDINHSGNLSLNTREMNRGLAGV